MDPYGDGLQTAARHPEHVQLDLTSIGLLVNIGLRLRGGCSLHESSRCGGNELPPAHTRQTAMTRRTRSLAQSARRLWTCARQGRTENAGRHGSEQITGKRTMALRCYMVRLFRTGNIENTPTLKYRRFRFCCDRVTVRVTPTSARSPDRCGPPAGPAQSLLEPLAPAIRHTPKRTSRGRSASLRTNKLGAGALQPTHTPRRNPIPPARVCSPRAETCERFRAPARPAPCEYQSRGSAAKPRARGDHIAQWLLRASPKLRTTARAR